jgi:hypothetical protein
MIEKFFSSVMLKLSPWMSTLWEQADAIQLTTECSERIIEVTIWKQMTPTESVSS